MKKLSLFLKLFLLSFLVVGVNYAENITVELTPNNTNTIVGDTINLDLFVKNIPNDTKCSGFETTLSYDSNLLNLTDIKLSDISNNADLKEADLSTGSIKIAWFSNEPSGNITIASLSFKTLNEATSPPATISLSSKTAVSNINGVGYNNITIINSNITINPLNQTVGIITINDFELNKNIDAVLSLNGAKIPIKNISGNIYFNNVSIENNPYPTGILCDEFRVYNLSNNQMSFYVVPNSKYENNTMFDFLKIPIIVNNSKYNISMDLMVNGKEIKNITVQTKETQENISNFVGLIFYVDDGYNENTNLSLGYSKEIKLKTYNINENLTNFSGYLYINNSLFEVNEYEISKYSTIYDKVNNSNITLNGDYLYFNISLNNGTNGTYSILKFKISPKTNINTTSKLFVGNLSIYSNYTKIELPTKNLTVNVIERGANMPPSAKIIMSMHNNKVVNFYALCYDADDSELNYEWDFGDGDYSTNQNPIHTYSNYTDYSVKLTVKDTLNASDEVKIIIPINKYNPLNYSLSESEIIGKDGENKTVFLKLNISNPLPYQVNAYVDFVEYADIGAPRNQYNFELNPNETKNMIIPINLSKTSTIKWNLAYYPLNKKMDNAELSYYTWSFDKKVKIVSSEKIDVIKYTKNISINSSKVIVNINRQKVPKTIVINKTIDLDYVEKSDIIYYCLISIVGFIAGLVVAKHIGAIF
ncbi:PKD domain containing protein [Methanococcus aeolicus Nankai-3]|uniref:PKD domain containing protein n=1 Tax=Methanococcus aeolicus (strain ATCC BAA-1280 / DSM 17508 / OCM 812 / Nankai-3) TaxID=419665 RepID=A6UT85_META3|nr:PKD domain-containing protein [Methanococcus aeolicus]ABR55707.1 PKD domain containing protein [Methanococcus aeolicus Nankai-3]